MIWIINKLLPFDDDWTPGAAIILPTLYLQGGREIRRLAASKKILIPKILAVLALQPSVKVEMPFPEGRAPF